MKTLRTFLLASLVLLPVIGSPALAENTDQNLLVAPKGHAQPRRSDVPAIPDNQSSGVANVDRASELQNRLKASDDRAINSICSDCLPSRKRPPPGQ